MGLNGIEWAGSIIIQIDRCVPGDVAATVACACYILTAAMWLAMKKALAILIPHVLIVARRFPWKKRRFKQWVGVELLGAVILLGAIVALPVNADSHDSSDPLLGLPPVTNQENGKSDKGKVELGEKLFKDKRLSKDGTVACATCHIPEKAFTDGQAVATGVKGRKGTRNTPTILNVIYYKSFFWDGRRRRLEGQVLDPLVNEVEHGLDSYAPVLRLIRNDSEYRRLIDNAFGRLMVKPSMEHVATSIAAYIRTKVTGNSPFDRWWSGKNSAGYDYPQAAVRGSSLFFTVARCHNCHTMNMGGQSLFTDNKFHNLGVGFDRIGNGLPKLIEKYREAEETKNSIDDLDNKLLTSRRFSELGRFAVTLDKEDIGAFKTPILRNVAATAPYMHDGSLKTLMDVIEFYNQGGNPNPYLDEQIKPLNLTQRQMEYLVAFLKTLTSSGVRQNSN